MVVYADDAVLLRIGRIACEASLLDYELAWLRSWIEAWAGADGRSSDEWSQSVDPDTARKYAQQRDRRERTKAAAEAHLPADLRDRVVTVCDEAANLAEQRAAMVHGVIADFYTDVYSDNYLSHLDPKTGEYSDVPTVADLDGVVAAQEAARAAVEAIQKALARLNE